MKKALLVMGLGAMSFLWGSQDVTIQVINAVYEKSITKEFDEKLKKSGIAVTKKVENGRHIVTLGVYKDEESAQKDLEKARSIVAKDAFVRLVDRSSAVAAKNVKQKTKVAAAHPAKKAATGDKTKVAAKSHTTEPVSASAKSVKTEAVTVSVAAHEVKPAAKEAEKKPEAVQHESAKPAAVIANGPSCPITPAPSEVKTIPVFASVVMVERNELRRQEIHDAIEYYKKSPYHRFEPVKLQP